MQGFEERKTGIKSMRLFDQGYITALYERFAVDELTSYFPDINVLFHQFFFEITVPADTDIIAFEEE
jgi:hypothetical protein